MPTLQEVLADPNYVNANFATKQAIFNKYASQDTNYSQANDATRFAIRQKYGVETPVAQEAAPTATPIPQRTYGEAAKDVGGKFVSGIGSLVQLPGQLYGLATGDFSKTGLLGAGEDIKKYGEEMLSPALKAKEEARAQKVQEAEKTGQIAAGATAFGETIKDPALLVGFLVEQIPQIIPALLTGGGTAALTAAGITAREAAALVASGAAKEAAQVAAKQIAAKKAGELGVKAAVGTGAVQQGADIGAGAYENIYKEAIAQGMSEPEAAQKALGLARAAGASGALISLLAQRLPGARTLEEAFAGVPGKTGRILGAGKGALGESVSEMAEEGGGKFTQNLAMREVNPEQDLLAGVGQAAGMAAIGGGGMGAIAGAARRPGAKVETLPPVTGTGNPPTDSPVVGTTTVNVGGKDSVKVNRADGSSDIDGVQVTPPTETAPGEPAAVETLPPADQGVPPPAEIPAAPTNVETLPPAEAPPAAPPPAAPPPAPEAPVQPEAPEFVPIETEQTKPRGVAKVEFTPEEKQEIKEVEDSLVQINKEIREAQAEKGSLFSMLKGSLVERPGAFSLADIDKDKKSLRQLYSASGQGVLLEDLVADGALDEFLPENNRSDNENFDSQAAIEHIAEKLRNGDYRTESSAVRLKAAQNQKAEIQAQLEKLKSVPSTNLELGEIAEQPKGEATEVSLKDLEDEALSAGVDVDRLREELSDSLPSASIEEFKGAYRNALFAATSGSQSYTIDNSEYTIDEIATYISEGFTEDEINELIAQAEAEQAAIAKAAPVSKPRAKGATVAKSVAKEEKPGIDTGAPPKLTAPAGFKLKEGRNEQVALAARALSAKKITKQKYDEYVNYYMPIALVGNPEPPLSTKGMEEVLKSNQISKINPSIKNGTSVGLRMDINALKAGRKMGISGSVVAIHPENNPRSPIGYASAAYITNPKFVIRNEKAAMLVAKNEADKAPQQTIEGSWVNMAPDEIFAMVKEKLSDPEWSQVSLDPLRHSFFYDRSNTKPVVSADEVLQVGRFVLAKNVKYGKRENYLYQQEGQFAGWNSTPEEMLNAQELNGKTMMQVADWSVKKAPNPAVKVIAEKVRARIKEMQARGIPLEFEIVSGQRRPVQLSGARGITEYRVVKKGYEGTKYSIYLNGNTVVENQAAYPPGTRYATVLHELIHVATVGQINYLGSNDPLVAEINNLYKIVADQVKKEKDNPNAPAFVRKFWKGEINAFRDASEMVAWGLTDRDMQEYLSTIKVGETSVFTKLVELFRKVLGLGKPFESALDRLIKTSDAILEEDAHTLGKKFDDANIAFGKETKPAGPPGEQMTLLQQEKPQVTESLDMRKAVTGAKEKVSAALQKRKPLSPTSFEGVPQDFIDKANPIFAPQKKTIVERIEEMKDRFWQRLSQGIADQFRTIKEYSEDAYMLARMSKTVDGALEGLMFHGQVFNDGGALNIKPDTKGMIEVLKPLGNEVDRYQMWVALNREADLPANKRSNIDNLDELVGRRNELIAGEIDGKPREQVYKAVRTEMNKLNRSVLKVALDSGLIDSTANAIDRLRERINVAQNNENLSDAKREKEIEELEAEIEELQNNPIGYERFIADINYIPFYREMEDGDVSKVMTATGLSNQHFSKALEGGVSPFADLMENTLRNWSHILSASMKNQAAAATLNAAEKLGGAEPNLKVPYYIIDGKVYYRSNDEMVGDGSVRSWMTESGKGTVKAMVDGQPVYYQVLDPLLLDSITSIGYMGPKSKFLDVARGFKNVLQFGVTISPAFKIRNLFRDSISAMAVSDLKKNPFANVVNGWALSNKDNPAHMSALAGGALFNFGSIVEGDQAALVKRLVKMGVKEEHILDTPAKIKNQLKKAWDKYQELGNKSESANRMALYQQMKDKGYGHLEASYYARDLLDFSMQGSWPAFRLLTQVVPFLNARTQGLYKLGKDGINPTVRVFYNSITGKPIEQTDKQKAEAFGIVTGAVCLASLALYFAFKDDEEFKKRDEWDRDNFWWFKLPGMEYALRIPKPFEIGAFGTLVERTAEQIFDQGSEGKQFEQSLKRMITDTFAVNLPQFFKPLVDLYANKDSFTGAPIESAGMERLSKQERATDTTSPLAIALGGLTKIMVPGEGLSPVQVDYAIKAYFGWLGGTIAETSHYAVMPFKDGAYPDTKWVDKVSVGFIKSLPSNQSKYATAFYENNKEISQAYADMRHYAEIGDSAKVLKILEEKQDKIGLAKFYDKTAKNMAKVRLQIRMITNDTSMDGATKREEIDRLKSLISMMAEQAEDTRKAMK